MRFHRPSTETKQRRWHLREFTFLRSTERLQTKEDEEEEEKILALEKRRNGEESICRSKLLLDR